jgi:hypothetical protein|tara:strand:+ start:229 stop:474 length:246 start_codon:yes stop_codon:yes gene_type:complete
MANSNPEINLSSYKNGNTLTKTSSYATVGDILEAESIALTEASIDIYDVNGQDKPARPGTVLAQGDTVQIVRKSNKSGIVA